MTRLTMMSLLAIVALAPACDSSRQKQDAGITRDVPADGDATNGSAGDCHTAFEVWCEEDQKCVFFEYDPAPPSGDVIGPASPDAGVTGRWICTECVDDSDCSAGERCVLNKFRCVANDRTDTGESMDGGTNG